MNIAIENGMAGSHHINLEHELLIHMQIDGIEGERPVVNAD